MNVQSSNRIIRLPRRAASVVWRYVTGQLTTREAVRIAMRVSRFERWGIRPIAQKRITALVAATAALREENEATHQTLLNAAELRRQLDVATVTIGHLREVEREYRRVTSAYEQLAETQALSEADVLRAKSGVQALVDKLQEILFERGDTTPQSRSAATLVWGNQAVDEVLATLVNLSEPSHGARPFQYLLPFLAPSTAFPLPWPDGVPPLRVVDVGSQELTFENDLHAPLRISAPVEVIGFDPFTPPSDAPDGVVEVHRPDGGTIRTYPYLLGDGGMVTFHVNRFDPTSSTLPSNHALTRAFGLLDLAVETIETRSLPSRRLDDILGDAISVDLLKIDVQGATHTVLDYSRTLLKQTLVCHVEAEFASVYTGEHLFADIDILLREAGFAFVDFFSLGRQRYASFDPSDARAFHRGRTLWADCIYLRGLDTPDGLTADELFRAALIMHVCYNKQDLAAELLGRSDALTGGTSLSDYIAGLAPEDAR